MLVGVLVDMLVAGCCIKRITLFSESAIYKLLEESIDIPLGKLNFADVPIPSKYPFVVPAMMETFNDVDTFLMQLFLVSTIYKLFELSIVIPYGSFNPVIIVLTCVVEIIIFRILLFLLSTTYKFPFVSSVNADGSKNLAFNPDNASTLPELPVLPANIVTFLVERLHLKTQ